MPSVIESASGRVPEKAARWDLTGTEACGGGKVFWWTLLVVWKYLGIYRPRIRVGGAPRGPQALRARPPASWAPCCSSGVLLPPIYTHVPPNDQNRSQKPNSTALTFCIHEIPSWGLFRSSAGGGINHEGLLHQQHSLCDDV